MRWPAVVPRHGRGRFAQPGPADGSGPDTHDHRIGSGGTTGSVDTLGNQDDPDSHRWCHHPFPSPICALPGVIRSIPGRPSGRNRWKSTGVPGNRVKPRSDTRYRNTVHPIPSTGEAEATRPFGPCPPHGRGRRHRMMHRLNAPKEPAGDRRTLRPRPDRSVRCGAPGLIAPYRTERRTTPAPSGHRTGRRAARTSCRTELLDPARQGSISRAPAARRSTTARPAPSVPEPANR